MDIASFKASYHDQLLRSSDQYDGWRVRIADKCWSKTGKDIFIITDIICKAALAKLHSEDAKADDIAKHGWVTKCWTTITKSLHEEILLKVAHIERGLIESLLGEIASSLTVYTRDEAGPIKLELYAATMEKCNSDLQTFIAYMQVRQRKLVFLKKALSEEDLVNIFINGLHPVLNQLKFHLRVTAPKKWDEAVNIVRTNCAIPEMHAELQKLRAPGLSQHMFPLAHAPTAQQVPPSTNTQQLQPRPRPSCHSFARGRCNSGANCRFSHTATPSATPSRPNGSVKCAFCHIRGHVALECRKRLAQLTAIKEALAIINTNK